MSAIQLQSSVSAEVVARPRSVLGFGLILKRSRYVANPASLPSCEELSDEDHPEQAQTPDKSNPGRAAPGQIHHALELRQGLLFVSKPGKCHRILESTEIVRIKRRRIGHQFFGIYAAP